MAMAKRVSLFQREVKVVLAPAALELLHDASRVISEGDFTGELYEGSTMMTVDLARTTMVVSDPPDATTAQRVAFLYASDERCRDHARRVAVAEAKRRAGCELSAAHIDIESRARGPELLLTLNVEAQRRIG